MVVEGDGGNRDGGEQGHRLRDGEAAGVGGGDGDFNGKG